jgi:hypothetical protein
VPIGERLVTPLETGSVIKRLRRERADLGITVDLL